MTKPTPNFTIDELLAELSVIEEGTEAEGWTLRELCEKKGIPATHVNTKRIRRRIDDLRAEGLWEMRKKYVKDELGEYRYIHCYRPK